MKRSLSSLPPGLAYKSPIYHTLDQVRRWGRVGYKSQPAINAVMATDVIISPSSMSALVEFGKIPPL